MLSIYNVFYLMLLFLFALGVIYVVQTAIVFALLFFFFAYVVDSDANVHCFCFIVTFTLLQLQDEFRKVSEECSQYKQIAQATKQKETKATSMVSELTSVRRPT